MNQFLPGGVEADFHGVLCALLSSGSPRAAQRGQWSWAVSDPALQFVFQVWLDKMLSSPRVCWFHCRKKGVY